MASGVDLIIATVCNATFCEAAYDDHIENIDHLETGRQNKLLELQALQKEINGKHLKIGTLNNYPMSWVEQNSNGTLTGYGVAFTLIEILRDKFNFTYEVVVPSRNFEIGGLRSQDSLFGLVNSSKVDMAAAFLPNMVEFHDMVQFTPILDQGVWAMMMKRPTGSAEGSGLLAPFDNNVWYMILAAVLLYGPCITLLTHLRSKLVWDKERYISLAPSFWYVYGAFIKQGTSLAPEANSTRVLFATWWLFIILLSAFYTANLTAFLTLSKFTLAIESPKDLLKKNYRWVAAEGSAVQHVIEDDDEELHSLQRMVTNGRAEFRSAYTNEEFLPFVTGGAVLVKEQVGIDHLMYGEYLKKLREGVREEDRCTFVVAPNYFMKQLRSFAYPRGTTLNKLFDPVLVKLLQAGILKFLTHHDLPSTKICPLDLQSKERRLRNSDLLMTYMIMVVGLAAALAVFIVEIVLKHYIHIYYKTNANEGKTSKEGKMSKESKEAFTFSYDDSQPPPYESLFGKNYKNGKSKKRIINGREYWVVNTINGEARLIPVRTPSAFLYQATNSYK